jgi:hypothetical protein
MFRLPCDLLDPDVVEGYCVGDQVSAWVTEEFVVLDLTSEDKAGDCDYDAEALLSAIFGVRAELATGDLRLLYLAWLAAHGAWERDEDAFHRDADDDPSHPCHPGWGMLTAAQRALADFLRLDDDLLTIAAQTSPPLEQIAGNPGELAAWVKRLPVVEKDRLLRRVVQGDAARIRIEMLRRFRGENTPNIPVLPRRTVADLLDNAARLRSDRGPRLAAQRTEEEAHHEKARALARERRLDELAREQTAACSRVDALIATRKPAEYDPPSRYSRPPDTRRTRRPSSHVRPPHHCVTPRTRTQTQASSNISTERVCELPTIGGHIAHARLGRRSQISSTKTSTALTCTTYPTIVSRLAHTCWLPQESARRHNRRRLTQRTSGRDMVTNRNGSQPFRNGTKKRLAHHRNMNARPVGPGHARRTYSPLTRTQCEPLTRSLRQELGTPLRPYREGATAAPSVSLKSIKHLAVGSKNRGAARVPLPTPHEDVHL